MPLLCKRAKLGKGKVEGEFTLTKTLLSWNPSDGNAAQPIAIELASITGREALFYWSVLCCKSPIKHFSRLKAGNTFISTKSLGCLLLRCRGNTSYLHQEFTVHPAGSSNVIGGLQKAKDKPFVRVVAPSGPLMFEFASIADRDATVELLTGLLPQVLPPCGDCLLPTPFSCVITL